MQKKKDLNFLARQLVHGRGFHTRPKQLSPFQLSISGHVTLFTSRTVRMTQEFSRIFDM